MKNQTLRTISLTTAFITSLLALNCKAGAALSEMASPKVLNYESSLNKFKSINNDKDKLLANDSAQDMKDMDHSKMGSEDMKGMDHSKMSPEDMKGMDHSRMGSEDTEVMDHSKMGADQMKRMEETPKKSAIPTKVKKLKPVKKMAKPMLPADVKSTVPADVNPHQNHQM